MITKEYLTEQGIPEDKIDGIIAEHSKEVSGVITAAKSVIKIEVNKEDNESDGQYLARAIKLDKDDAVSSVHNNYESTIKEVFGVEKEANQKGTDYLRTSASTNIESREKELKEQIKERDDKIKAGVKDPELIKERDEYKKLLDEERKGRVKDKEDREIADTRKDKISMLRSALPEFNESIPKKAIELSIKSEIDELMAIEGVEIFKDENGVETIRYGSAKGYITVKASEFFTDKFKGFIKEDSPKGGGSGGKTEIKSKILNMKDGMSPLEVNKEIQRHVVENLKKPFGSNEYYDEVKKIKTELKKG